MYAKPVSYMKESQDTDVRMCRSCHKNQQDANKNEHIILALAAMPLSMKEKWKCRLVSKTWNSAWMHFTEVRQMQYRIPHQPFNRLEHLWIRAHAHEFSGHNRLVIAFANWCSRRRKKIMKKLPELQSRCSGRLYIHAIKPSSVRTPCRLLMCSSKCRRNLSNSDILELLAEGIHIGLPVPARICRWMVPWYTMAGYLPPTLSGMMESRILLSENPNEKDRVKFQLTLANLPLTKRNAYMKLLKLVSMVNKMVQYKDVVEREKIKLQLFKTYFVIEYPYSSSEYITDIDVDGIVEMDSSSRPAIVPLVMQDLTIRPILVKQEDVRNDRLAQITLMHISRIAGIHIPTYGVMPTSKNSGWIEIMPRCTTLYDIKYTRETTIMDFIMEHNPNKTAVQIKTKFVRSVAVSCVLSYILGLGDRHLENIVVSEEGELLHIDFGYLFGADPHGVPSEMRITRQTLEAMGGLHSKTFAEFGQQCEAIYSKVRSAAPLWYALFKHRGAEMAHRWVAERLIPGEFDTASATQIVDIVHKNSSTGWIQHLLDTTRVVRKSIGKLRQ